MADFRLGSMVAEVEGDGPAIILIHGLGGSSNSFQPLMASLGGYRAIRPDLPGAGRSALRPGLPGIAGMAAAVEEIAAALSLRKAYLVGHSMGTLVAQCLAVIRPDLVCGMTLFGAITEPPPAARDGLRSRAVQARNDGMAGIAQAVSQGSVSAASRAANPVIAAFVRESLSRQDPRNYAAHCEALADWRAIDAARITCPALLVAGGDDPVAPPAMARALETAMPNAKAEILPGIGHWIMMEAPEKSAQLLTGHLKTTVG